MAKVRIFSVTGIQLDLLKSQPPQLAIGATGLTTTAGWSAPELKPLEKELSPDGILDLEFIAEPPTDLVPQVISPTAATLIWTADAERVVAVRVVARSNDITQFLSRGDDGRPSTEAFGEEDSLTTQALGEEDPITTAAIGEEDWLTTRAVGEETPLTTLVQGEEDPLTTQALGEEGGLTTLALGEESPVTTFAVGEGPTKPMVGEKPPFGEGLDPFTLMGRRNPFGRR